MKNYISKEINYFIEGLYKKFSSMSEQEKANYYSFLILKSIYDRLCEVDAELKLFCKTTDNSKAIDENPQNLIEGVHKE